MKKLFCILICVCVLVTLCVMSASAQTTNPETKITVGSTTAYIDGEAVTLDAPPILVDGYILAPARAVTDSVGASGSWDASAQTITLYNDDITIEMSFVSNIAKVNGNNRTIPVTPRIANERVYVPVRFVAETFGATVIWDADTQTMTINPIKVSDKFVDQRTYENTFTDISTEDWFFKYVVKAYELYLINGTSPAMFYPDAKVTVAEGLVLASNIHKTYYGTSVRSVVDGETWHAPYVDYCVDNGIITSNQFSDYSENLTRSEMALILGNALPFDYTSICQGNYSDLTENDACYEIATKFYCAGIVSAEATNIFRADDYISRAETAAMMVSLIFPEYRVPNIENNEKAVADLDGDGVVNVKDVLITLNAVINNIALDNTDVNGDGRVNLLDVLKILKFAVE